MLFTAYKYNFTYSDNEEYEYWNGQTDNADNAYTYGVRLEETYKTSYDVGFTLIGVQGGRYLGKAYLWHEVTNGKGEKSAIISFENRAPLVIPQFIIGDYFVWTGDDNKPFQYAQNGTLKKSQLYTFTGLGHSDSTKTFIIDTMREHIGGSLTDALKVARESLSDNNSNVVQFLQHLTANSIFVDKLVANTAFINQLFSHRIKLENLEVNGTTEHGAIYGGERYTADGEINDNSTEETQGFHLSSNGLLQANNAILKNIDAQGGNFENITATGGEFNEIKILENSVFRGNIQQGIEYFVIGAVEINIFYDDFIRKEENKNFVKRFKWAHDNNGNTTMLELEVPYDIYENYYFVIEKGFISNELGIDIEKPSDFNTDISSRYNFIINRHSLGGNPKSQVDAVTATKYAYYANDGTHYCIPIVFYNHHTRNFTGIKSAIFTIMAYKTTWDW